MATISESELNLINKYGFKKEYIFPEERDKCCFIKKINHKFLGAGEIEIVGNIILLYCAPQGDNSTITLLKRPFSEKNLIELMEWLNK